MDLPEFLQKLSFVWDNFFCGGGVLLLVYLIKTIIFIKTHFPYEVLDIFFCKLTAKSIG